MCLIPVVMDDSTASRSIITEGEESHSICNCSVYLYCCVIWCSYMADLLPWCICRSHIYDDVIKIYSKNKEQILGEYSFCVRFDGEKAVDTGGVCRDMYSSFWESAFIRHFDGESLLIPAVNPNTDMAILPLLGTILAHGYMVAGYLPVRVVFPVLVTVLCSPSDEITDSVLVQSFIDYISLHEGSVPHLQSLSTKQNLHHKFCYIHIYICG